MGRPAPVLGRRVTAGAAPGSLRTQPRFAEPGLCSGRWFWARELSLSLHSPDTWSLEATRPGLSEPWCHQWVCLNPLFGNRRSSVHTTFIRLTEHLGRVRHSCRCRQQACPFFRASPEAASQCISGCGKQSGFWRTLTGGGSGSWEQGCREQATRKPGHEGNCGASLTGPRGPRAWEERVGLSEPPPCSQHGASGRSHC